MKLTQPLWRVMHGTKRMDSQLRTALIAQRRMNFVISSFLSKEVYAEGARRSRRRASRSGCDKAQSRRLRWPAPFPPRGARPSAGDSERGHSEPFPTPG